MLIKFCTYYMCRQQYIVTLEKTQSLEEGEYWSFMDKDQRTHVSEHLSGARGKIFPVTRETKKKIEKYHDLTA